MPAYVVIIDILGVLFAIAGFLMAFRPAAVRSTWRKFGASGEAAHQPIPAEDDPVVYALRISGIMIMVFAIAIAGMMTLAHLAIGG